MVKNIIDIQYVCLLENGKRKNEESTKRGCTSKYRSINSVVNSYRWISKSHYINTYFE